MNKLSDAPLSESRLIMVPIARLNPIADGVRKTNGISIDALAASIKAEGLLQNLTVVVDRSKPLAGAEEFQTYQVIAGSRRLRALRHLLDRKELPDDYEVPCKLIEETQALSASLAENVIREGMHPGDEFMAFRGLIAEGKSIEDVAARFGVTPLVVQRRLRLANVAPKLFELFLKGEIKLDQMMALAISDDHAAQEKAWFKPEQEWMRSPHHLKEALTKKEISIADNPIAKFVGVQDYERAGGVVHKDLFSDRNEGYIADVQLLQNLAAQKLEAVAERVRKEAWSFVEVRPSFDRHADLVEFTHASPTGQRKPDDAERKRTAELTKERSAAEKRIDAIDKIEENDALDELTDAQDHERETLHARVHEIGAEIGSMVAARSIWVPKILAQGGAIVAIDKHRGTVVIHRGLVKGKIKLGKDAKAAAANEKAKAGHSESLTRELTAHVTFAIAAELIVNPDKAIIALTHRLALDQFYPTGGFALYDPVRIGQEHGNTVQSTRADGFQIKAADSPDLGKIAVERKALQLLLPKKSSELLAFLIKNGKLLQRLLAYCIAESVNAVIDDEKNDRRAHAIATHLKLNMATRWTAKAENYLSRVSAAQILAALVDAGVDKGKIAGAEKMKKGDLVKFAQPLLKNWLPKMLRFGSK